MAFGDFAQLQESLAHWVSSSTSYTAKPGSMLTTPALTVGTYLVGWSFNWQTEQSTTAEIECRLRFDGTSTPSKFETTNAGMRECDPGVAVGDSQEGYHFEAEHDFSAGVHTIEPQYRRDGTFGSDIAVTLARVWLYKLDHPTIFYHEDFDGSVFFTSSATYVLAHDTGTITLPAGKYRIGFSSQYRNETLVASQALRFRMRKDPAGADVITNLYGDDLAGDEALTNTNAQGSFPGDPVQNVSWIETCMDLEADDYDFQIHTRSLNSGTDTDSLDMIIYVEQIG